MPGNVKINIPVTVSGSALDVLNLRHDPTCLILAIIERIDQLKGEVPTHRIVSAKLTITLTCRFKNACRDSTEDRELSADLLQGEQTGFPHGLYSLAAEFGKLAASDYLDKFISCGARINIEHT